ARTPPQNARAFLRRPIARQPHPGTGARRARGAGLTLQGRAGEPVAREVLVGRGRREDPARAGPAGDPEGAVEAPLGVRAPHRLLLPFFAALVVFWLVPLAEGIVMSLRS